MVSAAHEHIASAARIEAAYHPAIDGLRAISIIAVLVYHIDPALMPAGFTGVDVFFVISGFVVTKSVCSQPGGSLGLFLAKFYRRRCLRILPALVAFLLVMALLTTLFIPTTSLGNASDYVGLSAFFGLSNFALLAFSGDYFAPEAGYNPFTHTWSLAVEEQFYLIFPIIFFLAFLSGRRTWFTRNGLALLLGLSALSLALGALLVRPHPSLAFYMLPFRFWELGAGAVLFMALREDVLGLASKIEKAPAGVATFLAAVSALLLGASFVLADATLFPFPWALPPVLATLSLLALAALRPETAIARTLATPPFVYVGRISYGLYLWHFGVVVLMAWTVGIDTPALQLLAGALSFALAAMSHRVIENPARRSPWLVRRTNKTIIVGSLSAVALASAASAAIHLARPQLSLSAVVDDAIWSPRGEGRIEHAGCSVARSREASPGWETIAFTPEGCGDPAAFRHMAVVGDSHAGNYAAMMQLVAGEERMRVAIHHLPGCQPFRFQENDKNVGRCRDSRKDIVDELTKTLGEGDVLVLAGLRVARFRRATEEELRENDQLDLAPKPDDLGEADLTYQLLRPLLDKGVAIIVEAPKPVFRSAPFRCVDWFTRSNPHCAGGFETSRAEALARRDRVMRSMEAFAAKDDEVTIWDPFPELCPGETCQAFRDGMPLFVDGDHLSRFGSLSLKEGFRASLRRAG